MVLGLFRCGLHGLGLLGLAAGLPGNRTPYEHRQNRLGRGDPDGLRRAGSVGAGWLTDHLSARGVSPINNCNIPVVIGLTGMADPTIVTALTPSTLIAVVAMSTALAFNGMAGAMCWALASVAAPRHSRRRSADPECGGYIGGALAPMITRFIVQDTGSFVPALLFSAALGLTCALVYVFMVPGKPIDVAGFGVAERAPA